MVEAEGYLEEVVRQIDQAEREEEYQIIAQRTFVG
jgi:uncharacterized protein YdbL (DUF1318 family)